MKPLELNLATEPFREERAQNAVWALGALALMLSLFVLAGLLLRERAQATDLRRVIESEQHRLEAARRSQTLASTILGKPENADVFSQNVLLNELIARRAVSWTHVFSDLTTVLPENIRLLSIRLPQVAAENGTGRNKVQLDMTVGCARAEAVIPLLKRLQTSALFGAASVTSQAPPTQNDPLFKYRLMVAYAQSF